MSPCTNTSHRRCAMALGFPIQNGSTSHVAVASQIAIRANPRTRCAPTLLRKGISVEEITVMIRLLADLRTARREQKGPVPPKCQCKRHATRVGQTSHAALQTRLAIT